MPAPEISVVVCTYNRGPILEKCLRALLAQTIAPERFELVIVDDGSTDDTPARLDALKTGLPAWTIHRQANAGRSVARNVGVGLARAELVCFIDSDVVVRPDFLETHLALHAAAGGRKVFVQGLSVNTADFERPEATPVGPFDFSAAFFATNNVSLPKRYLEEAGGFDPDFVEYGWEDLELGLRLKAAGVGIVRTRAAVGYHWHPAFTLADLPALRRQEEERGRMAAVFFRKWPGLETRLMIQLTPLHRALNALVTLGGFLDERRAAPFLGWLLARGRVFLAQQVAILMLNQHNLRAMHEALRRPAAP